MDAPKPKPRAIECLHIAKTFLAMAHNYPQAVLEIVEILRKAGAANAADDLRELVYREHPDLGR